MYSTKADAAKQAADSQDVVEVEEELSGLQRSHSGSEKESCTNIALTDEDECVSVPNASETNF